MPDTNQTTETNEQTNQTIETNEQTNDTTETNEPTLDELEDAALAAVEGEESEEDSDTTNQIQSDTSATQNETNDDDDDGEVEKKDPPGTKLTQLLQKDKEKRHTAQAYQQLEQQYNQVVEQAKANEQHMQQFLQAFQANPLQVLANAGWTQDQLISLLAGEETTPQQNQPTTDPKVEQLQQELQSLKQQQQQNQIHSARQQFVQSVQQVVDANPEQYELLVQYSNEPGQSNSLTLLEQTIAAYQEKNGTTPTWGEAMDIVEDYLTDVVRERVEKLKKTKKFEGLLGSAARQTNNTNETHTQSTNNTQELKPASSINATTPKKIEDMTPEELDAYEDLLLEKALQQGE